jgi:hypothetical protein
MVYWCYILVLEEYGFLYEVVTLMDLVVTYFLDVYSVPPVCDVVWFAGIYITAGT